MMKYFIALMFTMVSLATFAQDASEMIKNAEEQVKEAEKTFQDAQKEVQKLIEDRSKAENQLESSRVSLRQANIALANAKKSANPVVEERYEVIMNPVYDEMSKGVNYGVTVFIPGSETSGLIGLFSDNVDKEFKSYMKNYKTDKVKKSKGELFFDNISIAEISSTPIDIYTDFVDSDNGVNIKSYFNLGTEFLNFSNSTDLSVQNAKNIMEHFARYMRQKNLEEDLKSQEKKLESLRKDLDDYKKDIADAKDEMSKADAEVFENREMIRTAESEIDQTNEQLERTRLRLSKVQ